jgi:DNA-binding transcriptional LysR family regulator
MVMRIMNNKELNNLDFRSLRMLKILLETANVTKAGEALSISQPAASRVLAQLRIALGDPLLVRGRHGNTLTPRAEALRPVVSEALELVSTLFAKRPFDPRDSDLTLKIATTDNGAAIVLAPLARNWQSPHRTSGSTSHPGVRRRCRTLKMDGWIWLCIGKRSCQRTFTTEVYSGTNTHVSSVRNIRC